MTMPIRFLIIAALLISVFCYARFVSVVNAVPLILPLDEFPHKIGEFTRTGSHDFSPEVVASAGMDNYIMWQYQDHAGYSIGLYVGYYAAQKKKSLIHSPKHCMPGVGWITEQQREINIPRGTENSLRVNRMILQKGLDRQLVHYWYQGRGRIVANEYLDRALMVWDSLTRRRSDGSLVRITSSSRDLDNDIARQQMFINALLPVLDQYIPN